MTKLYPVLLACLALAGVAAAQGQTKPQAGQRDQKTGQRKFETWSERIKKARKTQTEEAHMRFKLGLMGLNPMEAGSMGGGTGSMSGAGGAMPGGASAHSLMSGHYGSSAMSKIALHLRHEMLAGYQSFKAPGSLAGSAPILGSDKASALTRLMPRETAARKRRLAARSDAKKSQILKIGTKSLLTQANAKGLKLPPGATTKSIDPASLRGTSVQPDASSAGSAASIYHNAANSGATRSTIAKAKAATQAAQNAHPSKGSIYKIGN